MIRCGLCLRPSPTNNKHKYSIVNHLLYIVYYNSHIDIKILSALRKQTPYTETKDCSFSRHVIRNLRSCDTLPLVNCCYADPKLRNDIDKSRDYKTLSTYGSRDSSVSIVTKLQAGQPMNQRSIPGKDEDSSVLHTLQTSSGSHPAIYQFEYRLTFPGIRRPEREYDY
jgi:hypothetical protein